MPIIPSISGREFSKFVESPTRSGEAAVEVTGSITAVSVPGPFAAPAGTDTVTRSVLSNVETYQYKIGGVSGTVLKTITITYTSADLEDMVSAVVS